MARLIQMTRRKALKAAASGVALPLFHISGAGAAGRLSFFAGSHRVPGADELLRALVEQWGKKNGTEVQLDLVSNEQLDLIPDAEAMAKSGHDVVELDYWKIHTYADLLEPVDDVLRRLSAKYGAIDPLQDYLSKVDGSYRAAAMEWGSYPIPACSRIDLLKQFCDIDVQAVFPAADHRGGLRPVDLGCLPCRR